MINNSNSILVTLSVSFWSGYKHDKSASAKTIEEHHMEKGAGKFNKKLLPKFALKDIKDIITQFKYFFSENTLPYNALLGTRILPASGFIEFQKETSIQTGLLNTAVNKFVKEYEDNKDTAKQMLGDLYNPADYPEVEQVRKKFAIQVSYFPVPEPERFSSQITNKEILRLNEQLSEMSMEAKFDLINRTEKAALALLDTLQRPGKRVHKSTVNENITKLSGQLETLNYENDELIAEVKEVVDENILNIRVDDVKDSPTYRKKMIKKTQIVLDLINEINEAYDDSTG
jgi:hypothetical protein